LLFSMPHSVKTFQRLIPHKILTQRMPITYRTAKLRPAVHRPPPDAGGVPDSSRGPSAATPPERPPSNSSTPDAIVSPLVRQLPWTIHLILISQCKRSEEREFYMRLALRERWGKRELERQLDAGLFERAVLNPPKVSAVLTQLRHQGQRGRRVCLEPLAFPRPHRRIPDRPAGQATPPAQTARILPTRFATKGWIMRDASGLKARHVTAQAEGLGKTPLRSIPGLSGRHIPPTR